MKDVSPIEINRVNVNTRGSEKSNPGSAFNFDELISKRLKQRKKCRATVMNQIMNSDVAVNGGSGTVELFPSVSDSLRDPEFNTHRSKSGMRQPQALLENMPDVNNFLSLRNSRSEWKLPSIGPTKNHLVALPFSIKLIPCEPIESEDELQSYDVFKTQAVDKAFNMSESFDPPKQETLQAGPSPKAEDDDLLELSEDDQRDNQVGNLFTFENIGKSQIDDSSD